MTTTLEQTSFNDEFVNRLSWLSTSDDPQLTEKVLRLQAEAACLPPDELQLERRKLEIEAWQEFHRKLQPLTVEITYAKEIVPAGQDVTARRLNPLLLNYIRASAPFKSKL